MGGMNGQSMETYTLPYVKEIANGNLMSDSGNSNRGLGQAEGWDGREETWVYLWLILVDI